MSVLAEQIIQFRAVGLSGVESAIARLRGGLGGMAGAVTGLMGRLGGAIGSVLSPMSIMQGMGIGIGMSLVNALGSGIRSAIGLATEVETLATSFEVLLGSQSKAAAMMKQINEFAAATPFEQMELADVAKQLLAYGTSAEAIIPTMRQLGDIAALSGANLGDLAAIYGKIQAQGRLTAETLEGFQARGIPITRELAKVFGVAESEVRNLVSSGQVGFDAVQKAIANLTGEGGQFAGGMERLSKTTAGLWSTVTGNAKTALANIGSGLIEAFNVKPVLEWAGQTLAAVSEWASGLGDIVVFVRENWRLVWEIIVERVRIFLINLGARVQAFAQNVVIAIGWLADNWRTFFADLWSYTTTVLGNLFLNLQNLWSAFWNWVRTGDWSFDWTPLTQGFVSQVKQWPAFVDAATVESTEKLDRLLGQWESRWREFEGRRKAATEGGETPATGALPPSTPPPPSIPASASIGAAATAAQTQVRATFLGFAELARSMQQKAIEDAARREAEAAQRTARGVDKLSSAVEGNALRVKLSEPIPGTYG